MRFTAQLRERNTRVLDNKLYSAGTDLSRQTLTSKDVSFRRQILTSKVDPHTARIKIVVMTVDL